MKNNLILFKLLNYKLYLKLNYNLKSFMAEFMVRVIKKKEFKYYRYL